jgi:SAM-dependent methyltransferase
MLASFHRYYLHQRFFPDLFSIVINPFYFSRKALLKQIKSSSKKLTGRLLDFGCGSKPYRSLFFNVSEYIGIDVDNGESHNHENENIDIFYDGQTIPFENEVFDSILASEVLEHVPDIDKILSELYRVLKKNGKILVTVPFVWPEHEMPYDFRRFTCIGFEKLLTDKNFQIISKTKSGSFLEVLFQMGIMYLHSLLYTKNKYLNMLINAIFIFPVCITGIVLTKILPERDNFYLNSVIVAEKINL